MQRGAAGKLVAAIAALYRSPEEIPDGFDPEEYEIELEVWPDNVRSFKFFSEICGTQWRVGMGGLTGLDYTAVLACIRHSRLPREDADQLFDDVRVMERAALNASHENN